MVKLFHQLQSIFSSNYQLSPDQLSLLPHSYKRVGHVAIINIPEPLLPFKEALGSEMLTILHPSIKTIAYFAKPIGGVTRQPTVKWLAGSTDFETVHLEHGTSFCINPQKIMLSAGNHFERKRFIEFIQNYDTSDFVVLDMFSCVGNLTLPVIKHTSFTKFIFLELNPVAVEYLRKSLIRNKIPSDRFTIFEGDNRSTCPHNVADVVSMGFFGIDHEQLVCALQSLNTSKQQAWIFIHDTGFLDATSTVLEDFKTLITSHPHWTLAEVHKIVVKSIGPGVEHWVFETRLVNRLVTQP